MSQSEIMKSYCLRIDKQVGFKNHQEWIFLYFGICDLSKNALYPVNWICNLPSKRHGLDHSQFADAFPNIDRQEFALELLNDALNCPEYSNDSQIKEEINKRIKSLNRMTKIQKTYKTCGTHFEVPRTGFKTSSYCLDCRLKFYSEKGRLKT